ncbi:hypothetical protein GCM10022384_17720 [Streptomyces marokkonensis]|uniref:Uncharacterized protein n=1 Tax=Streptomyces marokkonensis TaxID=324855 RepID=A0ABP7PJC1_9ACTN
MGVRRRFRLIPLRLIAQCQELVNGVDLRGVLLESRDALFQDGTALPQDGGAACQDLAHHGIAGRFELLMPNGHTGRRLCTTRNVPEHLRHLGLVPNVV